MTEGVHPRRRMMNGKRKEPPAMGECPLPVKRNRAMLNTGSEASFSAQSLEGDPPVVGSAAADPSRSGKNVASPRSPKKGDKASSSSSNSGGGGAKKGKDKKKSVKSHVPAFLNKTYEIMDSKKFTDIAGWTNEGRCIMIHDIAGFSAKILPKYFKHNNFTSFVRQLNMYGFHKTKQDPHWREFQHPMFKRGHQHLLKHIKRNRRPTGR